MRFETLSDWLAWQERLHPQAIELGLERVRQVASRLKLLQWGIPIVTVAGTNGKGSCVAYLNAIYSAAGYCAGVYTSPHLIRYNERIRIRNQLAADQEICAAFEQVEQARGDVSLTYFEFGTLAALCLFRQNDCDLLILEVGLGGRLDAVNILDADLALITSISADHEAWLGKDLDGIAREKAAVMRPGKPAVSVDPAPPLGLLDYAQEYGIAIDLAGREFSRWVQDEQVWCWKNAEQELINLPTPALKGEVQQLNAAAVLQAIYHLQTVLPVNDSAIRAALSAAQLPGRFSCIPGRVETVLDVAHNQASALVLAREVERTRRVRQVAVFGVLADKAVAEIVRPMLPLIDHWHLADLGDPRSLPAADIAEILQQMGVESTQIHRHSGVATALTGAYAHFEPVCSGDRVIVFGSFVTVTEALLANEHMRMSLKL